MARWRLAFHHLGRVWPHGRVVRAASAGGGCFGRRPGGDLCMENRPEFPIAETALMAIRAVPVPAYTTNTLDDHAHLLRDSGARAAIVVLGRVGGAVAGRRRQGAGWSSMVRSIGGARSCMDDGLRDGVAGRGSCPRCTGLGRADRGSAPAGRHRSGSGRHSGDRAGVPDLHLRHRRHTARGDAAAPLHPVQLRRRVRTGAAASASRTKSICPTCRCRTPTSIRSDSSSCSAWGPRSSMPAGSSIWRPTCCRCVRRS